ncbi:MAG: class I SAM-dependent methyltransferase, partial [Anaerolineales bacterium]|nr:class I SAM-dependent methyltransferase [Anaerolineales bacterium]
MSELAGEARARYVRRMFGRIAPRYDLLNRLMTFGQDRRWRREAVRRMDLQASPRVLDVGAGTGDLAFEVLKRQPEATLVALDFTPEMMELGRRRPAGSRVHWVVGDASHLPFAAAAFDGIVSGFLLRNVAELGRVLAEEQRVARSGARVVSLDTTPPPRTWLRP